MEQLTNQGLRAHPLAFLGCSNYNRSKTETNHHHRSTNETNDNQVSTQNSNTVDSSTSSEPTMVSCNNAPPKKQLNLMPPISPVRRLNLVLPNSNKVPRQPPPIRFLPKPKNFQNIPLLLNPENLPPPPPPPPLSLPFSLLQSASVRSKAPKPEQDTDFRQREHGQGQPAPQPASMSGMAVNKPEAAAVAQEGGGDSTEQRGTAPPQRPMKSSLGSTRGNSMGVPMRPPPQLMGGPMGSMRPMAPMRSSNNPMEESVSRDNNMTGAMGGGHQPSSIPSSMVGGDTAMNNMNISNPTNGGFYAPPPPLPLMQAPQPFWNGNMYMQPPMMAPMMVPAYMNVGPTGSQIPIYSAQAYIPFSPADRHWYTPPPIVNDMPTTTTTSAPRPRNRSNKQNPVILNFNQPNNNSNSFGPMFNLMPYSNGGK